MAEAERVAGSSATQGIVVIVSERMLRDIKREKGCGRGEEKRRGVSFSSSSSPLFQLQQLCLIEGTGTAGLPHGERDRRSTIKWLFQKKNAAISHYGKLLPVLRGGVRGGGWGEE